MNRETLNKIWDTLMKTCGAQESGREAFVALLTHDEAVREYRFIGSLGFGGKVWFNQDGVEHVNCYSEDWTPERRTMMDKANKALRLI